MASTTADFRSGSGALNSLGEMQASTFEGDVNGNILVFQPDPNHADQALFVGKPGCFAKSFSFRADSETRSLPILTINFETAEDEDAAKQLVADPASDVYLFSPPVPMRLSLSWPGVEAEATLRPATLRQAMQVALAMKDAASKGGWTQEKMTWKWDVEGAAGKRGASKELRGVAKVIDATKRPCFKRTSQAVEKTEKVVEGADAEEENQGQIQEKLVEIPTLGWFVGLLRAILRALRLI